MLPSTDLSSNRTPITHHLHTFHTIKSEPNVTISNSRHNLIGHNYQNPHNKKVHLISYPTLRTATKTDLRFERYDRNRFQKFCTQWAIDWHQTAIDLYCDKNLKITFSKQYNRFASNSNRFALWQKRKITFPKAKQSIATSKQSISISKNQNFQICTLAVFFRKRRKPD